MNGVMIAGCSPNVLAQAIARRDVVPTHASNSKQFPIGKRLRSRSHYKKIKDVGRKYPP
jgi:hypothetical protein